MSQALAAVPKGATLASLEAERTILSAVLVAPEVLGAVTLEPSDFSQASARVIYRAMRALDERGAAVDAVTIADELQRSGDLGTAGGPAALAALCAGVPRLEGVEEWAAIVREAATKRRLIEVSERVGALARGDGSAHDALEEGVRLLQDTAGRAGSLVDLDVDAQIRGALRALEESAADDGPGWGTALPTLDVALGPLQRGQLVIVAGRTGLGKSTMLANIGDAIAASGAPVLLFSAEMSVPEVSKRRLLADAQVSASHFERGGVSASPREWERISLAVGRLRARPFFVDGSAPTPLEARAKARIVKGRRGLAAVLFDYLQLLPAGQGRRGETREAEVARVSRALKRMAMDLDVLVIAASQLNRQADARSGGKPRLSDLRESGAQEQDADVVILLHRPDEDRDDLIEVQVAKHRNRGRSRWMPMAFDGATHRFAEPEQPA